MTRSYHYERAVELALAAIEENKKRPRRHAVRPGPKALTDAMREKAAKGETLTETDFAALLAAIDDREPPKGRGRGRPLGTRNVAARRAFWAALAAIEGCCGLNTYRNTATGHLHTQCDAIAEAMNAAGMTNLCTYDAVAAEMKRARSSWKITARLCASIASQMQEATLVGKASLEPMRRQMQELALAGEEFGKRVRAATTLSSEALKALQSVLNSRD